MHLKNTSLLIRTDDWFPIFLMQMESRMSSTHVECNENSCSQNPIGRDRLTARINGRTFRSSQPRYTRKGSKYRQSDLYPPRWRWEEEEMTSSGRAPGRSRFVREMAPFSCGSAGLDYIRTGSNGEERGNSASDESSRESADS